MVNRVFPEFSDLAFRKALEIDDMINDGNPAFEHWGSEKVFATFIIRVLESEKKMNVDLKPIRNREIVSLLKANEIANWGVQELRKRINYIIFGGS